MDHPADSPTLPDGTRLGRTALRVADLDAMTEFYRSVVGLAVQEQTPETATLGVDGTSLLVLERTDAAQRDPDAAGLFHNAFRVPSRAALGDAVERIRTHWQLDGASDHRVSEALYLSDPEDNGVEIYRDLPRDRWPRSADGTVEMATLPLDLDSLTAESDGATSVPPETTLGHVHLEATAIGNARDFYVDTLGFEIQMDAGAALFVSAGGYHHHLGINTWNGRSEPASARGLAWFEVVVPGADAVQAIRDRLGKSGVSVSDLSGGIAFTDPDGITVRLRVE
jgi:catechol 2,3-dioxygenase